MFWKRFDSIISLLSTEHGRRISGNASWLIGDKLLKLTTGVWISAWLARYLGPADFGILNYSLALTSLIGSLAGLGLQSIVVRELVREPHSEATILGTSATLQFFGGLLSFTAIGVCGWWLREDDEVARSVILILGSVYLLKPFEFVNYWFESRTASKILVIVQNCVYIVFAFIKILFLYSRSSFFAFVWLIFFEALLTSVVCLAVFDRIGVKVTQLNFAFSRAKQLVRDSWPLMLSSLAIMVYMRIDQLMIGQMLGNNSSGIFGAAVRISEVFYLIPMAIGSSLLPSFLKIQGMSQKMYEDYLQIALDVLTIAALLIAVGTMILAPNIVEMMFGSAYEGTANVLIFHIWAGVFIFQGVISGSWYLSQGILRLTLLFTLIGALVNVTLNLFMIPKFGAVGAAITTVIAQACSALIFESFFSKTRRLFLMKIRALNAFHGALRVRSFVGRNAIPKYQKN